MSTISFIKRNPLYIGRLILISLTVFILISLALFIPHFQSNIQKLSYSELDEPDILYQVDFFSSPISVTRPSAEFSYNITSSAFITNILNTFKNNDKTLEISTFISLSIESSPLYRDLERLNEVGKVNGTINYILLEAS